MTYKYKLKYLFKCDIIKYLFMIMIKEHIIAIRWLKKLYAQYTV